MQDSTGGGYFYEDPQERLAEAKKKAPKDYSRILPFMAEPTPTKSRRTSNEIAYRKMGDAIEGLDASELRSLADFIVLWREYGHYEHLILHQDMIALKDEQDERRERQRLDRLHPVIDFQKAKQRKRHTHKAKTTA